MVQQFDAWAQSLGAWGFLAFGLAALIEYVVPPFPGDTIVLLGGIYAVRGERSWLLVLLAVTLGSVIGMSVEYWVGRAVAHKIDARHEGKVLGISLERIRKTQEQMRKNGTWLLIVNRFLPTFRSMLFVAAGAARISYGRVLTLGTASALAWNGLILALGLLLGGNIEKLEGWLRTYQTVAFAALAAVLLAVAGRMVWKRTRSKNEAA